MSDLNIFRFRAKCLNNVCDLFLSVVNVCIFDDPVCVRVFPVFVVSMPGLVGGLCSAALRGLLSDLMFVMCKLLDKATQTVVRLNNIFLIKTQFSVCEYLDNFD